VQTRPFAPSPRTSGYIPWNVFETVLTTLFPLHKVCNASLTDDSAWFPARELRGQFRDARTSFPVKQVGHPAVTLFAIPIAQVVVDRTGHLTPDVV
jgi:hypothetical protein